MALRYVMDSDILIHLERGHPAIMARFEETPIEAMATTIMNRAELLVGAFYRRQGKKRLAQLDELFSLLPVLPFDDAAAVRFGRVKTQLIGIGKAVPDADLIIAAIAMTHHLTLVTNNVRDFHRVPGLKLQSWHR